MFFATELYIHSSTVAEIWPVGGFKDYTFSICSLYGVKVASATLPDSHQHILVCRGTVRCTFLQHFLWNRRITKWAQHIDTSCYLCARPTPGKKRHHSPWGEKWTHRHSLLLTLTFGSGCAGIILLKTLLYWYASTLCPVHLKFQHQWLDHIRYTDTQTHRESFSNLKGKFKCAWAISHIQGR